MFWATYWAIIILTMFSISVIGLNSYLDNDIIHGTLIRHFESQNRINISFVEKISELDHRINESEISRYKKLDAIQDIIQENSHVGRNDKRIAGVTDVTDYQ